MSQISPSPPPITEPSSSSNNNNNNNNQITPIVLFIIVLLSIIFFICSILHLLVRYYLKPKRPNLSTPPTEPNQNPERQLQQLFNLHDSGLDQALIDALPVFLYKDIKGLKEPFDCAVCLCEFSEDDKLRLLPNCSHAFHLHCIDTWLLSNSTCPLCRGSLYSLGYENSVREESFRVSPDENDIRSGKRVFSVRLGKFKSINNNINIDNISNVGETSSMNSNVVDRRCFSMGSYQYIVAELDLEVALNLKNVKEGGESCVEGKKIINMRSKGESFSVSKIWQWSNKRSKFQNLGSDSYAGSSVSGGTGVGLNGRRFQGP